MPVIWGLDLKEFTWSKFGSKNMWNNVYHLRRTKFIIYQCAMIFCVVSESLGTAALSDYVDQQNFIQRLNNNALEYNNDYIGAASYNIFAGIFVATIFGGAFFFDLIWPERHEDRGVRIAWKISAVAAAVMYLGAALALTIITATKAASVHGVGAEEASRLLNQYAKYDESPLVYRHNSRAVASIVFAWLGFVSVVASAALLIVAKNHDEKFGPWSSWVLAKRANDPEANNVAEKTSPPPVGPRPTYLATDEKPAAGEHALDAYSGEGNEPASFEASNGARPASAV